MEKDRIAELPDEAFFQLLIVSPLREVILFERVYGQQRPEIFAQAKYHWQDKYGFPDLTLEQMLSLLEAKDDEEKASLYLDYGDFPKQVAELNLEEKFVEYAIEARRDLTALALLQKYESPDQEWWVHLKQSIEWRCLECVKYLLEKHDFEEAISDLYFQYEQLSDGGMLWLLKNTNVVVTEKLISSYLSFATRINFYIIEKLFERASYNELKKAYKQHQESLLTGIAAQGGDYPLFLEVNKLDEAFEFALEEQV